MTTKAEPSIDDPFTQLTHSREWVAVDGGVTLGSRMSALVNWLDSKFVAFAADAGAAELPVSRFIERSVLERAGYFESFPASGVVEESAGYCLPPATCYHCYARLASTCLDEPGVWRCIARCCRNEQKEQLGRLRTFTIREIVLVGPAAWVRQRRQEWMDRILAFAHAMNMRVKLEPATDPFFLGENRGRKLLQQLKQLKCELSAPLNREGTPLAISSFNLHETFFSRRFGFRLADGSDAYSGCVAFGLERWALALTLQLGPDVAFRLVEQEHQ
jgi:hypothetical protein